MVDLAKAHHQTLKETIHEDNFNETKFVSLCQTTFWDLLIYNNIAERAYIAKRKESKKGNRGLFQTSPGWCERKKEELFILICLGSTERLYSPYTTWKKEEQSWKIKTIGLSFF
jgi:hypothetical protein